MLGAFLFSGEDQYKKVKILSGGEKARLALCKLLLKPANFLILDEPTNHLDIQSKKILKEALKAYSGTLIIVSHDREFLSSLTEKVFEFSEHNIKEYIGDIDEYLLSRKMKNIDSLVETKKPKSKANSEKKVKNNDSELKRNLHKAIKRLKSRIAKTEEEIAILENELSEINKKISNSDTYQAELINEYQGTGQRLERTMRKWENDSLELESLDNE